MKFETEDLKGFRLRQDWGDLKENSEAFKFMTLKLIVKYVSVWWKVKNFSYGSLGTLLKKLFCQLDMS